MVSLSFVLQVRQFVVSSTDVAGPIESPDVGAQSRLTWASVAILRMFRRLLLRSDKSASSISRRRRLWRLV